MMIKEQKTMTPALVYEMNDFESDTNNAKNEDVDSMVNRAGKDKSDRIVNGTADEINQCTEKMNVTQEQDMKTDQIFRAAKDSVKGGDIDVD